MGFPRMQFPKHVLLLLSPLLLFTQCNEEAKPVAENCCPGGTADTLVHTPTAEGNKFISNIESDCWNSDWSTENTVVVSIDQEPISLHPTNYAGIYWTVVKQLIHKQVIALDLENLGVRPDLVKSLPEVSEDGLRFTYTLRDEPRWDDGSPLSLDDILFTLKVSVSRFTNNDKSLFANLADVELDRANNQFTLVMAKPYVQNIAFLTDMVIIQADFFDPKGMLDDTPFSKIIDPSVSVLDLADLSEWSYYFNDSKYSHNIENLVGLGPYKITLWEADQRIELVRKENHWTQDLTSPSIYETAFPEKILLKIGGEKSIQQLELKRQALDVDLNLSTETLMELQTDESFLCNYQAKFMASFGYSYMVMNQRPDALSRKPFFTDRKVREAMALLTPVEDIIQVANNGYAKRQVGPTGLLELDYNPNLKPVPHSPEKAMQLLDEAGWTDSNGDGIRDKEIDGELVEFSFDVLHIAGSKSWGRYFTMISRAMETAGIKANAKAVETSELITSCRQHDFDAMLLAWGNDPSPDDYSELWSTNSWASNGLNFGGFGNAESDALIDSINQTVDLAARIPMSHRLQRLIAGDHAYVFLTSSLKKRAIHNRFKHANIYYVQPFVLLNNLQLKEQPKENTGN